MNRQSLTAIACGVVPMTLIHLAYWLNIEAGTAMDSQFICNPYLDGCVSTSRAVRSGPGLLWFKAVMLPVAVLMLMTWRSLGSWMARFGDDLPGVRRWTIRLGIGGAIALVFYVLYLGTEGAVYSWLRRYGVIFFFGFTALAQLVAARFVVHVFPAGSPRIAGLLIGAVTLEWGIGVFSVLKRFLFEDAAFIDRLENITEWAMIAVMSVAYVLIGLLMRRGRHTTETPSNRG